MYFCLPGYFAEKGWFQRLKNNDIETKQMIYKLN